MSTALATFAKQNRGVLSRIASELGVKRAAVCKWQKRIPPERVLELERVTGISRSTLRPDLYPAPDGGPLASDETAISSSSCLVAEQEKTTNAQTGIVNEHG